MPTPQPATPGKPISVFRRLRALGKEEQPRLRFGFLPPWSAADSLRLVLPFRRNWLAIASVGIIWVLFSLPLLVVARQARPLGHDLFALVFSLFHLFWGLGWSVGAAILGLVFLGLLLGREVVVIRPDSLLIRLELLGLGVGGEYPARGIGNPRRALPDPSAGTGWRGEHLTFDYYTIPVAFGSALGEARAAEIIAQLRARLIIPDRVASAPQPTPGASAQTEPSIEPALAELAGDAGQPAEAPRPGIAKAAGWQARLDSPSAQSLLLANLLPLAGVYFLDWQIGEIMLLYWAESGIIGLINLLKMAVVGRWSILFYGPFFLGHYGAFMAVHLLFVYGFFVKGLANMGEMNLAEVAETFLSLWPGLLALTISHLISFRGNFLGQREYTRTTIGKQLHEPYGRIIAMHLTIIGGGFVAMLLGTSWPALGLLIFAKTVVDLNAHHRQRH